MVEGTPKWFDEFHEFHIRRERQSVDDVLMSDGNFVEPGEALDYYGDSADNAEDMDRGHKMDTILISSAAGIGVAALALALHRLHKKQ